MNLYLLEPTAEGEKISPTYDVAIGFVIAAKTPSIARKIITTTKYTTGDEGRDFWLNPELTKCKMIGKYCKNKEEIILWSFHAG